MKLNTVLFVVILILALVYINQIGGKNELEELQNAEAAIQSAAITCYALEGAYPPLDYLEEHYGIMLNHDKFYYHYEMIGSNVLPIIKVIRKPEP